MRDKEPSMPCVHCGSENTRRNKYAKRTFGWMLFLFGIPFPAKGRTWLCFNCHKEFTPAVIRTE